MEKTKIDNLFFGEEIVDREILGQVFRLKEIDGETYMSLAAKCADEKGNTDRNKYAKLLIQKVVMEPKEFIDRIEAGEKLSAGAMVSIITEIEDFLGVQEAAQEQAKKMKEEQTSSQ